MSQNWRARVAAEFGQPLNDLIQGFKDAGHSINSTAQIIGISPHTLRQPVRALHASLEFNPYALAVAPKRVGADADDLRG